MIDPGDAPPCLAARMGGPDHPPFLCGLPAGHEPEDHVIRNSLRNEVWRWPSTRQPPVHEVIVRYRNTDDGIWLECRHPVCGWEKNIGFEPTVGALLDAAGEHLDG